MSREYLQTALTDLADHYGGATVLAEAQALFHPMIDNVAPGVPVPPVYPTSATPATVTGIVDAVFTRARRTDPATSKAAARSLDPTRLRAVHKVLCKLLEKYGPMTDAGIADRWPRFSALLVSPSGLRSRRAELVKAKLVRDSGKRETTNSGRQTIVWELTDVR